LAEPVSPPDQLVKLYPAEGTGVSVTVVPEMYGPAGSTVTLPPPVGLTLTVRSYSSAVKFAVTVMSPFIVTIPGLAEPVSPPDQLVKLYPAEGTGVSVTVVPEMYGPAGSTVTLPPLSGFILTVNS